MTLDLTNPYTLTRLLWPDVRFYRQQREIIQSVDENDETLVPAGNQLGKDYVAGFIAVRAFLLHAWRLGGCRIITTSVKDDHLRVLWGEIGRFIQTSKYPLTRKDGGNLIVNHRDIRWIDGETGEVNPISYLRGLVSEKGEGMAGHHAAYTLGIIDEASGVDEGVYDHMRTWAKRILVIGNPNECENFFKRGVKQGDILAGYHTRPEDKPYDPESNP